MLTLNVFIEKQRVTFISTMLRSLFYFLDSLIYKLSAQTYGLLDSVIHVSKFIKNEQELIGVISDSLYAFISVIMLFWLAFNLLTMIIDPDKIEDKQKGVSKIAVSVIFCIIAIILTPQIFNFAFQIQEKVIEDKIIERIFIGDYEECEEEEIINNNCENKTLGVYFARSLLSIFLSPRQADASSPAHDKTTDYAVSKEKYNMIISGDLDLEGLSPYINTSSTGLGDDFETYNLNYIPILSTVAGLYLLWVFLSLMIDIAMRSLKLFVFQLIAPIPIISLVSPTSSKSGMFKKWMDEVFRTYTSLFIKIAAFSVGSLLMYNIDFSKEQNFFAKLFFLLAILTVMQTLPKLLEKLFSLQPKDKVESFGKKALGGLIGGAAVGTVGSISGAVSAKKHGHSFTKGFLTGGAAGIKSGFSSGYELKPWGVAKSYNAGTSATAKKFGYSTGQIQAQKKKLSHEQSLGTKNMKEFENKLGRKYDSNTLNNLVDKYRDDEGIVFNGLQKNALEESFKRASTYSDILGSSFGKTAQAYEQKIGEHKVLTDRIEGLNKSSKKNGRERDMINEKIMEIDRKMGYTTTPGDITILQAQRDTLVLDRNSKDSIASNIYNELEKYQKAEKRVSKEKEYYEKEIEQAKKSSNTSIQEDVAKYERIKGRIHRLK